MDLHPSALYGEPDTRYKMPEVNMGSSIVTAMPVMENAVSSCLPVAILACHTQTQY